MNYKMWISFILFIAIIVLIYSRHLVVQSSYQLQELEKSNLSLREKNLELQSHLHFLMSPDRLQNLAPMYGLFEEKQNQIIYLKE